jgi:hypothetical protein
MAADTLPLYCCQVDCVAVENWMYDGAKELQEQKEGCASCLIAASLSLQFMCFLCCYVVPQ